MLETSPANARELPVTSATWGVIERVWHLKSAGNGDIPRGFSRELQLEPQRRTVTSGIPHEENKAAASLTAHRMPLS